MATYRSEKDTDNVLEAWDDVKRHAASAPDVFGTFDAVSSWDRNGSLRIEPLDAEWALLTKPRPPTLRDAKAALRRSIRDSRLSFLSKDDV